MKKLVYSLIASLCLVGCSEDMNEIPQNGLAQQGSVKTLTATVGETESRTSLDDDGNTVLWSANDAIALTDGTTWAEYTLTKGEDTASATFEAADEAVPEAETYYAYYPAGNVTDVSGGTFTVTLPATQTYTAGSFAPDALPMMAVSTSTDFQFKHVCGLLKLTLKNGDSNGSISISKVLVSADEPMSGTATVTCEDDAVATLTAGGAVTVAFGQPLALAAGASKVVYVALPVKEYTKAKITVITADDKYRTFSAGTQGFAIKRAKFSNVELNLSSETIVALPEISPSEFYAGLNTAVTSGLSDVRRIIFKPNADNVSDVYDIVYNDNTKTATVRFAAPMAKLTSGSKMFRGMSSLESVDLSCFDTSEVTYMSEMFFDCKKMTSVTFGSNFNTGNVTDMSWMFYNCSSLTSLDVSGFNTGNVTNMQDMFSSCEKLTSLDVSGFDTGKVTNMQSMFSSCKNLTSITFGSSFNTGNVTDMSSMFSSCKNLTSITFGSSFNTGNVTDMSQMFYDCRGLTSLDLSGFNTGNVTDMSEMFYYCSGLTSITFGSSFNTGNVTDMYYMFAYCYSLASLDLSSFNTGKVTNMSEMFYYCKALASLDLRNFSATALVSFSYMFTYVPTTCAITISKALYNKVGSQHLSGYKNINYI